MTSGNRSRQRGQAMIEALIGIPALVVLIGMLILSLAVFSLRLHLVFLSQELATCGLSVKPSSICELQADQQIRGLFRQWGFQDVSLQVQSSRTNARVRIQAIWKQDPIRIPIRWELRESVPFDGPKR